MTQDTRSPEQIERDLAAKRSRIDDTIDALQEKLSPGQLLDQGLGYLRGGGASEFGSNLGRTVRDNPVPIALVGIGLTWLMTSGQSRGHARNGGSQPVYRDYPVDPYSRGDLEASHYGDVAPGELGLGEYEGAPYDRDDLEQSHYGYGEEPSKGVSGEYGPGRREQLVERMNRATSTVSRKQDESKEAFDERVYTARAQVLDMQRKTDESYQAFKARVDARYHAMLARASAGAEDARRRVTAARARAGSQARNMGRQAQNFGDDVAELFREQPLLLGALGCAVGALFGALLPSSRTEDEVLGPYRDQLRDDVGRTGEELAERAAAVGDRAYRTAGESAEREGLTPEGAQHAAEDVAQRVSRVASETEAGTRDEARRQGLE